VPPMALSRVLLGVHYPSDVATGVAVGAAVAAVAAEVDRRWPARPTMRAVKRPEEKAGNWSKTGGA
jgi:membrane-associated phospholipid phosphatase